VYKRQVFHYRARAKDNFGNISEWSKPCSIIIVPNFVKWIFPTNSGIYSGPAVGHSNEIYLTTQDGTLYTLANDGTLKWRFTTSASIFSAPVVGKKAVVITSTDNKIYALDFSGKLLWTFSAEMPIYSTPAIDNNGNIYFGCDDGNLYALSATGKLLWKYQTGDEIAGSPAIDIDGTIIIASGAVFAFTPQGKIKWIFRPNEEDEAYFTATPTIDKDGTIYVGGTDGAVYALNRQGRLKWRALSPDEDPIRGGIAIDKEQVIYFGAENGTLYKKEFYGEIQPVYESDYYLFSTPAIDSLNNIYFVSDDGYLYCLGADGKLLFKYQIAEDSKEIIYSPSPIITDDGTIYIGSWEGNLYAIKGFAPPAKSPWPYFRLNQYNTACKK
ncbi:MAG: PQQ-binding-like beta-propeller repeat protein, partial [candidate division WOR-3 bacterium]|nr:PQQ-binding-like beta-propeller repeat protein [candidate division WOR-3 bacterium]